MNKTQLINISKKLMETAASVCLTTVDGRGIPFTRAMLNLRNRKQYPSLVKLFTREKGELVVYFTTNTSSDKVKHIKGNSAVSVYYCDPSSFHGFMLGGRIKIVKEVGMKKAIWQKGWERYYPGGFDDPDHTVLKLVPKVGRGWHQGGKFSLKLNKL